MRIIVRSAQKGCTVILLQLFKKLVLVIRGFIACQELNRQHLFLEVQLMLVYVRLDLTAQLAPEIPSHVQEEPTVIRHNLHKIVNVQTVQMVSIVVQQDLPPLLMTVRLVITAWLVQNKSNHLMVLLVESAQYLTTAPPALVILYLVLLVPTTLTPNRLHVFHVRLAFTARRISQILLIIHVPLAIIVPQGQHSTINIHVRRELTMIFSSNRTWVIVSCVNQENTATVQDLTSHQETAGKDGTVLVVPKQTSRQI